MNKPPNSRYAYLFKFTGCIKLITMVTHCKQLIITNVRKIRWKNVKLSNVLVKYLIKLWNSFCHFYYNCKNKSNFTKRFFMVFKTRRLNANLPYFYVNHRFQNRLHNFLQSNSILYLLHNFLDVSNTEKLLLPMEKKFNFIFFCFILLTL